MQWLTVRPGSPLRAIIGLWLVAFLSFGPTLAAATRTVDDNGPADFTSITAALAASSSGDVINVAAGTYDSSRETFPLALKDGVAIVGAGPATTTILGDAGPPVFVNDSTPLTPLTRLQGFTIAKMAGPGTPYLLFLVGNAIMSPVITGNFFQGNVDEVSTGIAVMANRGPGVFDGQITANTFQGLGFVSPPPARGVRRDLAGPLAEGPAGGIYLFHRPAEQQASRSARAGSNGAALTEDVISPTISGNTFEANGFGIATVGTSYYDCLCDASGILAPTIDNNDFATNFFDNLLTYSGFGVRNFSPTITNNGSSGSFVSVASFPYFYGGGGAGATTGASALKSGAGKLRGAPRVEAIAKRIREGQHKSRGVRAASSSHRVKSQLVSPGAATLMDVTVSNNTIAGPALAGVLWEQYTYSDSDVTVSATFDGNDITGGDGGIIFEAGTDPITNQLPGSFLFQNNVITGTGDALFTTFDGGTTPAPANAVRPLSASATDVQYVANTFTGNETGLTFGSNGYLTQAPLASCNAIQNNSVSGVTILTSSDPNPDFGGGARSSPGKNSIHNNLLNMDNQDAEEVKAENNYWGSTDSTAIDTSINGLVDFTPFLSTEPTGCANIVAPAADLAMAKVVTSSGPYFVGSNITYQLTVTNNGPGGATAVVITDPIPANTTYVSGSAGCSANATTITCTTPTLASGASQAFNITVQATATGTITNTASADSAETDNNAANNSATAAPVTVGTPTADLVMAKTVTSTGPYVIATTISYQLTVTNNGPNTATNVVITDPIPANTQYLSGSAGCSANATTITCTTATLANGASQSFTINLRATGAGTVVNTASADSVENDPNAANSTATSGPVTVTAAVVADAIPTTSEWGLLLLAAMMAIVGVWFSRRQ